MSNEHHSEGPSKYPAWQSCLCWDSDKKNRTEADEGSRLHNEIDQDLKGFAEAEDYRSRWACEQIRAVADEVVILSEYKLVGTHQAVKGIFGTVDAMFYKDDTLHIFDFKSFSDGTNDYSMQLKGYASLALGNLVEANTPVKLHILHAGIMKVEVIESTAGQCYQDVEALLDTKRSKEHTPSACVWCKFCSKVATCQETNKFIAAVADDKTPAFSSLSLPEKLVILDVVDKMSSTIREEAKAAAKANGGKLECFDKDGNCYIKYEMVQRNAPSSCTDICELASAIESDVVLMHKERSGAFSEVPCEGLTPDELIKLCSISKTAIVNAVREKNKDNRKVKKCDIEVWLKKFFKSNGVTEYLTRTI